MVDIRYNLEGGLFPIERIGPYTWKEFVERVNSFHNYPSPGVIIGGIMIDITLAHISADTEYHVIIETPTCLPDSVQILTPCTVGNDRLKIINLGRYALSLFDKYSGEGIRVYLDPKKLLVWDEIETWLLKRKPKKEQDAERLREQIRMAGYDIYTFHPVRIKPDYVKKHSKGPIGICSICGEAYPLANGAVCLGCQGEAPYENTTSPVIV
jgi:formylmethanofuran dehydrogenase subunit E